MKTLNYDYLDEEKGKYWFPIALLLSLIGHVAILLVLHFGDALVIDLSPQEETIPKEVTFVFPENKPKQIVENMNENESIPEESDLLSDRNSKASNPNLLSDFTNTPYSEGNIPLQNLSRSFISPSKPTSNVQKKFTRESLTGRQTNDLAQVNQNNESRPNTQVEQSDGTNNMLNQNEFSADNVGNITLSTYAWEYAPYLNAFKKKYLSFIYPPPAFRMGLIEGVTYFQFTIDRKGTLLNHKVLGYKGHVSLKETSINALISTFPFKPLPSHFPEETLTVTVTMSYIFSRQGSN